MTSRFGVMASRKLKRGWNEVEHNRWTQVGNEAVNIALKIKLRGLVTSINLNYYDDNDFNHWLTNNETMQVSMSVKPFYSSNWKRMHCAAALLLNDCTMHRHVSPASSWCTAALRSCRKFNLPSSLVVSKVPIVVTQLPDLRYESVKLYRSL